MDERERSSAHLVTGEVDLKPRIGNARIKLGSGEYAANSGFVLEVELHGTEARSTHVDVDYNPGDLGAESAVAWTQGGLVSGLHYA